MLVNNLFAQKRFVINGKLKGIPSGIVKLGFYSEITGKQIVLDSTHISNGDFTLKGTIDQPHMALLMVKPGHWFFDLFVDAGNLVVTADTTGSVHTDYTPQGGGKYAEIKNFSESGSKNVDDLMRYLNDPGQKQYEPVIAGLRKKLAAAGSDVNAQNAIKESIDSVAMLLKAWQKKQIDVYVNANPSSIAGLFMFYQLYTMTTDIQETMLEDMLNKFTGDTKLSIYYKLMADALLKLKAVQPGSVAPNFTLLQRDSTKFTLSSTRGKYVMIDFWASWCHPCRAAIPYWKSVYQKYHNKGFEIVSVSDDNKWSDWIKAMDVEKMPWIQVDDEFPVKYMAARVGSLYMTTYIPFYVLLDKEGKILVYSNDEDKVEEKLGQLLGK